MLVLATVVFDETQVPFGLASVLVWAAVLSDGIKGPLIWFSCW